MNFRFDLDFGSTEINGNLKDNSKHFIFSSVQKLVAISQRKSIHA